MAKGVPAWAISLGKSLLHAVEQNPVQAMRDGTPRRVADQIGQWVAHLGANAAITWAPALLRREMCVFCEEEAMGSCRACKDPTCLGHAHVSYRAELICDECVEKVSGTVRQKTKLEQAFEYFHLTQDASLEEVRVAYRARSKVAHPDQGGTKEAMQAASAWFKVLEQYFERRAA